MIVKTKQQKVEDVYCFDKETNLKLAKLGFEHSTAVKYLYTHWGLGMMISVKEDGYEFYITNYGLEPSLEAFDAFTAKIRAKIAEVIELLGEQNANKQEVEK